MREQWNTKLGFLLAAIGSAVGLGNIWRFPYIAAQNGGGAFLLPYFFAIITAGIPILILEYTLGKTYKAGAPVTLARINKKFEWLGWFQVMVAFMISVYYFAIIVWVVSYIGFSATQAWGADPTGFFVEYLGLTNSAIELGGIQTNLIIPFIIVWAVSAFILYRGVSKGIEMVCKICLPVLFILIAILVIRGITLPGAADGLEYMFAPNWAALAKPGVWVAAYGQIFFSLSIAFAIMISYSSYLPKETDVVNSAFITATANHGFEVFAGIGVFSIMGYMALMQGVPVEEIAKAGVGLAFMTFPAAISSLPALNGFFGVCFFGALLTAGITSLISIMQAVITGIEDKFNMPHKEAVTTVIVPAFIVSILFITGAGLNILDIVDAFINNIGIAGAGLLEVVLIGWFFDTEKLRQEANSFSNFSIGRWWVYSLKIITVVVLGVMVFLNTKDYLMNGYGGYAALDIAIFGWGTMFVVVVISAVLTSMKGKEGYIDLNKVSRKEVA
ncbi:sodium-dependent transporter [Aminipila sp.]|uniref:sodium-dependent transporter n=1 Tax=Aminipila sp. TaxID=2060095 RepID=UPI00289D7481|nr:sodium-dependent transporter [Aminipila sp.]